jgi:endo-1,4-beta-xylanase
LAARHFNTITPENAMKWGSLHPEPGVYNFATADRYVAYGEPHNMFIVGHTLIRHNQTPDWVFEDEQGQPVNRDELLDRMKDHIRAVVRHYKGRVHAWDVVNEAINRSDRNAGTSERRPTRWQTIIGDDYIEQAFRFAHEADPDAELYYNDYNLAKPKKRTAAIQLVKSLRAKGVRVDGIGTQCHVDLDWPSILQMETMLDDLIAELRPLGIKVMVTELDVASPGNDQRLADRYAALFRVFTERSADIDRVTFWGVHDGQSWLRGKKPLLFNDQLQPKQPAFNAVLETK